MKQYYEIALPSQNYIIKYLITAIPINKLIRIVSHISKVVWYSGYCDTDIFT